MRGGPGLLGRELREGHWCRIHTRIGRAFVSVWSKGERLMSAPADLREESARIHYRNKAFIGGRYVDAASGETFECVSPVDGRTLTRVASCDKEDVDRAVRAARAAFDKGSWSELAPSERKKVLQRFARGIEQHA